MFAGGVIFAEIIKICPVANGDRSVYKLTYIRYAVLKAHVHTSGRDRKQTACGFESLDSVNVPLNYFCTCSEKGTVKVGKNQNVRKILHDCSLVYDIADLYKAEIVIPTAFQVAADTPDDLPAVMRRKVRDAMVSNHILERMVHDIRWLFQKEDQEEKEETVQSVYLWDDKSGTVRNGYSYGQEEFE